MRDWQPLLKQLLCNIGNIGKNIISYFQRNANYEKLKKYYILLLLIVGLQYCSVYFPFVFSEVPIISEYWGIPEQTLLTETNGKEIYVDNTEFINQSNLFGLQYQYDPRKDHGKNRLFPGMAAKVKLTAQLNEFIDGSNFRYFYDASTGQLVSLGAIPDADIKALQKILPAAEINSLNLLKSYSVKQALDLYMRAKTDLELQFIAANYREWAWQNRGQGIIHHKSFIFEPVRDIAAGKPITDIYCQYGYGMALLLGWLCKAFGGVSFGLFTKLLFSFYFLYLPLLIFVSYRIIRRWDAVALIVFTYIGGVIGQDYPMLYAYDGCNPIRFIYDLPVIYFFYRYSCSGKPREFVWLTLFSMLELFHNKQFGLFLAAALIGALIYRSICSSNRARKLNLLSLAVFAIAGVVVWLSVARAPDVMTKYFFAGYLSSGISSQVPLLLTGYILSYCLLFFQKTTVDKKAFSLFLLLYLQMMMLFYVLEGNLATVFALLIFVMVYFVLDVLDTFNLRFLKTPLFFIVVVVHLFFWWYPALNIHYSTKSEYFATVSAHKQYHWAFSELGITTDMEPQLFAEAAALINKYADSKQVALISRYDSILLPASGRVSLLPYSELSSFLIGDYELNSIKRKFIQSRPLLVFVDSDINVNHAVDIVREARTAKLIDQATNRNIANAVYRIFSFKQLQNVWLELADKYELVETGRLLTVFRLKGG